MAGFFKIIIGEKELLRFNEKMNANERICFSGAFAYTSTFNVEKIYVKNGTLGNYFDAYILTIEKDWSSIKYSDLTRSDFYVNYEDLKRSIYENFRLGNYYYLFEQKG